MFAERVQFSHQDGIWVVDEMPRNPPISQPSMQSPGLLVLNEIPRNPSISRPYIQSVESWILDELPINPSASQPHPMELWISEQIQRLQNCDLLQRIREQLVDLQLETKTKVFENDNSVDADICAICQTEFDGIERVAKLRCGHEYHGECIKKWLPLKNVCPLCKETALDSL